MSDSKAPERAQADTSDPIAIVGIGCRFPGGVNSPDSFWNLLRDGVDAIAEVPKERWSIDQFYHPDPPVLGSTYSKWGGFIENIDLFDPGAFGISPREAQSMDPQQRLMLEVTMEALEDAGLRPGLLRGSNTGVFTGISTWDYWQIQYESGADARVDPYTSTGTALSIVANRISYCFDFHGPSMVVDTACSSSLVALHLACESIRKGDCDTAISGGVNAFLSPVNAIAFSKMGVLSPDGRCKAFDAGANGFVRGEGAGAVVLKPLSRAMQDRDRVYAVIQATGTNQDGVTNGLAVPNAKAQAQLTRNTFAKAGIETSRVAYVEAHGTGTVVGDPTEAQSVGETFGRGRTGRPCLIGSVKTNIGHLESAAGIAGLIKAALVIERGTIPPSLHFHTPNPHIDFAALGLEVVTEASPLAAANGPASPLVVVNSFGFGGTNAIAVLSSHASALGKLDRQDAVSNENAAGTDNNRLIPLSALSEERLAALCHSWAAFLPGVTDLYGVGFTTALRRDHRAHRLCVVAANGEEAAARIKTFRAGERTLGVAAGKVESAGSVPRIVFVFSGQGPQWFAMGRTLYETNSVYRRKIEECDEIVRRLAGWSLIEALSAPEGLSRIRETAVAQPALCALQIALAEVWKSWGIVPAATIGHSVGELAAAHVSGRLTLGETLRIVWHRGVCTERFARKGGMLAAALPPARAMEITETGEFPGVAIAAFNSPHNVTFAGPDEALASLNRRLEHEGVSHRFLHVDYAFHSALMDDAHEPFVTALGQTLSHAGETRWISTVTHGFVDNGEIEASYWWRNIRQPVCFAQAMERLIDEGFDAIVEIGPHPVLLPSIAESFRSRGLEPRVAVSLRREGDDNVNMLTNLGLLHCWGCKVDWRALYPDERSPVSTPGYPWKRELFWCADKGLRRPCQEGRSHPILGTRIAFHKPVWRSHIDLHRIPFLKEHCLQNRPLFPATAYLDMALAAAHEILGAERPVLENIELRKALFLPTEPDTAELLTEYDPADREIRFFSLLGGSHTNWSLHCKMHLRGETQDAAIPVFDRDEVIRRCPDSFPGENIYEIGEASQFDYGASFRSLKHFWRSSTEVIARVELPAPLEPSGEGYYFHPAFLDACIQASNLNRPFGLSSASLQQMAFVPVGATEMRLFRKPESRTAWVHVIKVRDTVRSQRGDIWIYDDAGAAILVLRGFESQGIERKASGDGASIDDWAYRMVFVPTPRPSAILGSTPANHRHSRRPALASLAEETGNAIEEVLVDSRQIKRFEVLQAKLDDLALTWWEKAFRELGLERCAGLPPNLGAIVAACGIAPQQMRYAEFALTSLIHAGVLHPASSGWQVAEFPVMRADPAALGREILAEFPIACAELMIFPILGSNLTDLLTGETTLQEQLFSRAAEGLLEHFYQDSVGLISSNSAVAQAVARFANDATENRKLRILEVGAGTGGVTSHILPLLEGREVEYTFTDVSPAFLTAARRRYAGLSFVNYRLFDLQMDPASQGFAPDEFDVIVAANMVHAVPDVTRSLAHIGRLLAPGGVFCLLEVVKAPPSVYFIFGLTEQFWHFANERLELMSREKWRRHLEAEFHEVVELPQGLTAACSNLAEFAIFLARKDDSKSTVQDAPSTTPDDYRPRVSEKWLILADRQQLGAQLANRLETQGASCRLLSAEDGAGRIAHEIQSAVESGNPYTEVVLLWSIDCTENDRLSIREIECEAPLNWEAALVSFQSVAAVEGALRPRIYAVTSGVQPVGGVVGPNAVAQSAIRGILSVAVCEYPGLKVRHIDLDAGIPPVDQVEDLFLELTSGDTEQEVAFRDAGRFVARLRATTLTEIPDNEKFRLSNAGRHGSSEKARFELHVPITGTIDRLSYRKTKAQPLLSGQLEVRTVAAGLNFRDVLKVLGLYPLDGDYTTLGDECAGIVERVGEGVTEFKPGDEVICVGSSCFASHVISFEHLTMPKPAHLMFEEAATLPIAFLTAHYGLHEVGRLQSGETVLIHAAAGGVGLAAIQIAQRVGAAIVATASARKHPFLRMLGVEHVLDSRSLEFAEQIRGITGGRGVDVILNSLAGEAIDKSLSVLARYGRFVEIGKRDLYENRNIGLGYFRDGIAFHSVDLSRLMADKPDLIQRMKRSLTASFQSGELKPLAHRIFAANRIREAFRTMAEAKHVGKIIISMRHAEIRVEPPAPEARPFREHATYLITGGCGGFGAEIARAMLANGARNIVLVGRSSASSEKVSRTLALLAPYGNAKVTAMQADVADPHAMAGIFRRLSEECPPLRGVVHAAGILEDGPLVKLDAQSFHRVIAPKVYGAWNLHELTQNMELDFFWTISSSASVVGNAGQTNYAAANAFLDTFAYFRHSKGLPANVVNFGALADSGMAARDPGVVDRMARLGVSVLPMRKAIEILRAAHLRNHTQIGAIRVRWSRWLDAVGFKEVPSKLLDVYREDAACASSEQNSSGQLQTLHQASPEERPEFVTCYVALALSRVLGTPADKLDPAQPLHSLGLDSLATIELCNRLERDLRITLPLSELAKQPSLTQLSSVVLQLLPQTASRHPMTRM